MKQRATRLLLPLAIAAVALRCSPADSEAATRSPAVGRSVNSRTLAGLHLVVAPTGNEARYRIREQLVRMDLPTDAVGKTGEIAGGLGVDASGKIIAAESKFTVNVGSLQSDRDMRDGYVRRRVLETDQYPTVEFVPTEFRGLPKTLPASGVRVFDVVGNMTVHGVTRPTTWHVTAEMKNSQVTGNATTQFKFADFGLPQPRVPVLLSVADSIKLEYDFTLVPKS